MCFIGTYIIHNTVERRYLFLTRVFADVMVVSTIKGTDETDGDYIDVNLLYKIKFRGARVGAAPSPLL